MSDPTQRLHTLQTERDHLALENERLRTAAKYALYTCQIHHPKTIEQTEAIQELERLLEGA